MTSMTTTAAAYLAEATRLYQQGNLHGARDVAEEALLSLHPSTGTAVNNHTTSSRRDNTDSATQHDTDTPQYQHALFGNALLLLSAVYTAVKDFAEADRLLVTCEGYWREHLGYPAGDTSQEGRLEVNEGLAGVAYNRAVLRLEQLGAERVITTQSQSLSQQQQQHRREVADAVLHTYLDDARQRLDHTLGRQRCLLADVHHSIGVCHLHCRRYVEALSAWQQSLAIRTRVQHCCHADNIAAAEAAAGSAEELKAALTLEHVAQVYQLLEGRGEEALKMLDAVADTRVRLLGPRHPLYARTLLAKAVLAEKLGRLRLARALLEACHSICGRSDCECDAAFVKDVEQWRCYLKGCTDVAEPR